MYIIFATLLQKIANENVSYWLSVTYRGKYFFALFIYIRYKKRQPLTGNLNPAFQRIGYAVSCLDSFVYKISVTVRSLDIFAYTIVLPLVPGYCAYILPLVSWTYSDYWNRVAIYINCFACLYIYIIGVKNIFCYNLLTTNKIQFP